MLFIRRWCTRVGSVGEGLSPESSCTTMWKRGRGFSLPLPLRFRQNKGGNKKAAKGPVGNVNFFIKYLVHRCPKETGWREAKRIGYAPPRRRQSNFTFPPFAPLSDGGSFNAVALALRSNDTMFHLHVSPRSLFLRARRRVFGSASVEMRLSLLGFGEEDICQLSLGGRKETYRANRDSQATHLLIFYNIFQFRRQHCFRRFYLLFSISWSNSLVIAIKKATFVIKRVEVCKIKCSNEIYVYIRNLWEISMFLNKKSAWFHKIRALRLFVNITSFRCKSMIAI